VAQSLGATANSSTGHDQRYQQANEAGQAAAIASVQKLTGQPHQVQPATQVFYNAAAAANAAKIAGYFGAAASASTSLPAGHVEVLLGTSVTAMPAGLGSPGAAGAGAPTATATSAGDNGAAAGTVTVNSKTPYGTPGVY
jgi:hypothetical protein